MNLLYFGMFTVLLILISFVIPADAISPNQQIKNGILPLDVICENNSHTLLIRPSGDSTVCATEKSAQRLVNFGWIKVNDLLGDDEINYFISMSDLVNSIYLFENRTITISGNINRNDVAIPLVECNYDDDNIDSQKSVTLLGYKLDQNSSYFISDELGNTIGARVLFATNNTITINHDDLGDTITVTGIIKPAQFAPDWCDSMKLQQSAYLELLSIQRKH